MFSWKKGLFATAMAMVLAVGTSGGVDAQQAEGYAQGQQQHQYQAQPPQQQQQANVTAEDLRSFVEAESAARDVQQEYQQKAANAQTESEMTTLQQQMTADMTAAIEEAGMSVEEYNLVLAAIQSNQQVRQQYMSMIQ